MYRPILAAAKMQPTVCGFWRYQACADIRRGSLLRWCQMRVRSSKMRSFCFDRQPIYYPYEIVEIPHWLYTSKFTRLRGSTDLVLFYLQSCLKLCGRFNAWFARILRERSCLGYRSNNFIIGLTDVSPGIRAPTLWNYDVCAQYPGVVGDGATVSLPCQTCMKPHRYLILQIHTVGIAHLTFCEIEVYIGSK